MSFAILLPRRCRDAEPDAHDGGPPPGTVRGPSWLGKVRSSRTREFATPGGGRRWRNSLHRWARRARVLFSRRA